MKTYVSIDSSVGRGTEFTFLYTGTTFTLDVVVISPSGVNYAADGPNGHDIKTSKQIAIVIKNETEVILVYITSDHYINMYSLIHFDIHDISTNSTVFIFQWMHFPANHFVNLTFVSTIQCRHIR